MLQQLLSLLLGSQNQKEDVEISAVYLHSCRTLASEVLMLASPGQYTQAAAGWCW